uniref:OSJNBb0015C06.4 protein n=1 Tax=Oryza sativa subsp. japonica TaxID=39947 RepID=Q7XRZ2_ORYSJ|nr:OSJNBb0015C06.4 [Oryza sativa Japonica Group]
MTVTFAVIGGASGHGPSQMDRRWMYYAHCSSTEYREGVTEFVTFAKNDRKSRMSMHMLCLCRNCKNEQMIVNSDEVHAHLIMNGFMKKYTCWTKHGEQEAPDIAAEEVLDQDVENTAAAREGMFVPSPLGGETIYLDTQCLSTMLHDIEDAEDNDRDFEKFSILRRTIYRRRHMKRSKYYVRWAWRSEEFMHVRTTAFCITRNTLTWMSALSVGHQDTNEQIVKVKEVSQRGEAPTKVVWYLPIAERMKRMFANKEQAKLVRWNAEERKVNRKWACSECMEETRSKWLKHSHKTVYMGHRRFLPRYYPYRNMRKNFNGHRDTAGPPTELTGTEVHNLVMGITNEFGKKRKIGKTKEKSMSKEKTEEHVEKQKTKERSMWKKKSIFWRLPYWKDLEVRHCIDLMHVEKNVCESLTGLLLNPGTTKDGLNARRDLEEIGVHSELHPITTESGRVYLPPACYTLSKEEKIDLLTCLSGIKVPSGYSSRISRLVSLQDLKLVGMKSYDCHVLITQLLPVAIRNILPPKVRHTIQRLCSFFHAIGQKIIDPEVLDELQAELVRTLCHLEMYFPPTFFDIMEHLSVHLGSIIESYTTEEVIDFCVDYMLETSSIGLPRSHHEGRLDGVGTVGRKTARLDRKVYDKAHFTVLQHMTEVVPYVDEHLAVLRQENLGRSESWVRNKHMSSFNEWLKNRIAKLPNLSSQTLQWLSQGPEWSATTWQGYDINGYTFHTVKQDSKCTVQNSGLRIEAPSDGVLLFRCQWVNLRNVKVDNEGFTTVNLANNAYKDEPFVLAKQVVQVFYIVDPCNKKLHVVREGKRRIVGLDNIADEDNYNQHVHGIGQKIPLEEEEEEDDV